MYLGGVPVLKIFTVYWKKLYQNNVYTEKLKEKNTKPLLCNPCYTQTDSINLEEIVEVREKIPKGAISKGEKMFREFWLNESECNPEFVFILENQKIIIPENK